MFESGHFTELVGNRGTLHIQFKHFSVCRLTERDELDPFNAAPSTAPQPDRRQRDVITATSVSAPSILPVTSRAPLRWAATCSPGPDGKHVLPVHDFRFLEQPVRQHGPFRLPRPTLQIPRLVLRISFCYFLKSDFLSY